MKLFFLCMILLCFLNVCYNETDIPEWLTPFKKGSCLKIFYRSDTYYKNYCIDNLPKYNNSLGIETENKDVIVFEEIQTEDEEGIIRRYCYEIHSSFETVEVNCMRTILKNCLADDESVLGTYNKKNKISCRKVPLDKEYCAGLANSRFVLIIYCDTIEEEVFHETAVDIAQNKSIVE